MFNVYLRQEGYVFVCLFICMLAIHAKTSGRICVKFSEKVGNGPMINWLNFGSEPVSRAQVSGRAEFLANVNSRSRSLFAVARPSVVCLSVCLSVTLVHPTQAVQIFGNISTALSTLAIRWHPLKILRRSSQGNPSGGELNTRGVAKYSDFGPIDGYILTRTHQQMR